MLLNNVDIKVVSELLGHSSVYITYKTYIHVIKSQKRKAIAELPNILSMTSNDSAGEDAVNPETTKESA